MKYTNKRLLIVGGNPETGALVKHANELGVYSIVIDPNPNASAKKFAKESYEWDIMDIESLYIRAK